MRKLRSIQAGYVLSFFLLMLSVGNLHAQRYLGTIAGEVTDATGAKVPGAEITVEETGTHFKSTVVSNAVGSYTISSLNPGTYTVTAKAANFGARTIREVLLTAGQLQTVDFGLNAGAAVDTVNVSAESPLLDTGSANIATTLSNQEVTDLPNEGRNPFVMATLAAGVINGGSGGYFQGKSSQFTNPFSGTAIQVVSGGSSGHNRLTIDGIPDDPPERLSGASYTGFVPSPEAVQEVKVQSSIFDAQVGHGNGTVTNTVVRNGTNKLHGAAYYVFQDTYLNANTHEKVPNQNLCFPGTTGCTNTIAPTRRNNDQLSQTGFVVDGPVFLPKLYDGRNKSFFMVAFERYASHTALNYSARVPTAAELGGDFSGLCSAFNTAGLCTAGVQLYVPNSPLDANSNRTSYFLNNNLATRSDSVASAVTSQGAALASYLPAPNVPGALITGNNYISTKTSYPSTYPSFIVRFDQLVGQKDKLNAIFFRSGLTQSYPLQGFPKGIGPTAPSAQTSGYGYNVYRNNRGGSLDEIHQFSSNMVLDSRFGLIYHPFGLQYPGAQGFNLASLNIPSTGLPYTSFPGFTASDAITSAGLGASDAYAGTAAGALGQISESTTGSLEEILTYTIRTHTLRIGFEGNLLRYNVQNPQSGFVGTGSNTAGFAFDRRFTQKNSVSAAAGSDPNSGDAIADLLLGDFSLSNYYITPAYALQQLYMAPFVQDDWRATSKLTVNLGFRWDYESPFTERYNKQVTSFCTTCVNPLQASVVGLALNGGLEFTGPGNRYPYPKDLNNFQPRLGASFQATPTTVVRAGFGIIYFNTLESPIGTGFSQLTSNTNYTTSAPLNTLANPFPTGVVLPTGNSLGLSTALGQNVTFADPNHVQPKSAQYSASVQQQLPGDVVFQIAYVGSRPTRLEVNHNINLLPQQYYNQGVAGINFLTAAVANPMAGKLPQSTLNTATLQRQYLLLPYPEFGTVTEMYSSIGSAPYNALQLQVSKPMKNHFSLQANLTWDKLMLHNGYLDNYQAAGGHLESIQDNNPTVFANIFGTVQLPRLLKQNVVERLALGGWQVNTVARLSNGPLIPAPANINIVGNPVQPDANFFREFNTCSQTVNNTTGAYTTVVSSATSTGCDARSPNVAFQQRLSFTSQSNSPYLNIREPLRPIMDLSVFKQFIVREGVSFEIRGEFFNALNTPNYAGPNTTIGAQLFGSVTTVGGSLSQANDPRIGQLTARINF